MTGSSVIAQAVGQRLSDRGQRRYTNLGAALLGLMLAESRWCRVRRPVTGTDPAPDRNERHGRRSTARHGPLGHVSSGLPRQPWAMEGFAPAGGVYSTLRTWPSLPLPCWTARRRDLLSTAAFEGIPTDRANRQSGMFWIIDSARDHETMLWHNGGTGLLLVDGHRSAPTARRRHHAECGGARHGLGGGGGGASLADQSSRAAARRARVALMVRRFRSVRSSTPDTWRLNSMADSGRRSSLHSVTRDPDAVGSIRYPQVE